MATVLSWLPQRVQYWIGFVWGFFSNISDEV